MKKLFIGVVTSTFVACSSLIFAADTQTQAETMKCLLVDVEAVYNGYDKAIESREKLQDLSQKADQEHQKMVEEAISINEKLKQLEAKMENPASTEAAKEKFKKDAEKLVASLEEKQMAIYRHKQSKMEDLGQRQKASFELRMSEIRQIVSEIKIERGANLVLNKNDMLVLDSDPKMDFTNLVIERLNSRYPSVNTSTPASK